MTTRERVSLILTLLGFVAVVVAAGMISGWWWSLLTGGILVLIGGVLLGLDDHALEPEGFLEEPDELGGPVG